MRPDIDISHQLNGRVRDYAEDEGISADEAYRRIIEAGLTELADE
jgi:hypothetical protein